MLIFFWVDTLRQSYAPKKIAQQNQQRHRCKPVPSSLKSFMAAETACRSMSRSWAMRSGMDLVTAPLQKQCCVRLDEVLT